MNCDKRNRFCDAPGDASLYKLVTMTDRVSTILLCPAHYHSTKGAIGVKELELITPEAQSLAMEILGLMWQLSRNNVLNFGRLVVELSPSALKDRREILIGEVLAEFHHGPIPINEWVDPAWLCQILELAADTPLEYNEQDRTVVHAPRPCPYCSGSHPVDAGCQGEENELEDMDQAILADAREYDSVGDMDLADKLVAEGKCLAHQNVRETCGPCRDDQQALDDRATQADRDAWHDQDQ